MKSTTRLARSVLAILLPLGLILGIAFIPSPAHAQDDEAKKKATQYYKQGTTQFKLGNFDEAIKYFKLAYETSPHHAFLFNLGQAYRQKGDCKEAIFFYKGYLSEAGPKAKNRELVEQHIRELTEICDATEDSKNKPPDGALSPGDNDGGGDGGGDGGDGGDDDDDGDGDRVATADTDEGASISGGTSGGRTRGSLTDEPWKPSLLAASVIVGPALLDFGGLEVGGAQPSVNLNVGYPLSFGKIGLILGASMTYTPVPWEVDGMSGTATLASALVSVGVRYSAMKKLDVGADISGGGLFLAGLEAGDVFLPPGEVATGALTMPNLRLGLALDYLLTNNLMISAKPVVFSMSPAKDGLRPEVETFRRIEFMVGVGYRM